MTTTTNTDRHDGQGPNLSPPSRRMHGTATVSVLLPVQSASREYLRKVLADIDAVAARRTPDENAAIDRLLSERGVE